jgi:hypothetical protein
MALLGGRGSLFDRRPGQLAEGEDAADALRRHVAGTVPQPLLRAA